MRFLTVRTRERSSSVLVGTLTALLTSLPVLFLVLFPMLFSVALPETRNRTRASICRSYASDGDAETGPERW